MQVETDRDICGAETELELRRLGLLVRCLGLLVFLRKGYKPQYYYWEIVVVKIEIETERGRERLAVETEIQSYRSRYMRSGA